MDLSKFTDRARGFLQAANVIATREDHQMVVPEHILKALLDDDKGFASNLITRAGGLPARVKSVVDQAVANLPKVTGDAQVYLDTKAVKVVAEAEALAQKAGDSFIPVERILVALAVVPSAAKEALSAEAITPAMLDAAIAEIRKGRTADSASAEDGYDALNKYTYDLT